MAIFLLVISAAYGKLFVHDPEALTNLFEKYLDHVIPSSLANFGNPPYGSSLIGKIYIPKTKQDACTPLDQISFTDEVSYFNHPIILVERGYCSYVVKVRNAQTIGASAVIIADNVDEKVENIVMIDDGTAGNIYIPSILISKRDAQIIKDFIANNKDTPVRMTISFEIPRPDNRVEYEI